MTVLETCHPRWPLTQDAGGLRERYDSLFSQLPASETEWGGLASHLAIAEVVTLCGGRSFKAAAVQLGVSRHLPFPSRAEFDTQERISQPERSSTGQL